MNPRLRPALASAALLAATALSLTSCADKPLTVDPSFTTPEGRISSEARLVLWSSLPNTYPVFRDLAPIGAGPEDVFLRLEESRRVPDGSLLGMLFDGTAATAFQVLRRESNRGLRPLTDFPLISTRKWLDGQWEVYEFVDLLPTGSGTASISGNPVSAYIGRGLISGGITENSPLSNEAQAVRVQPIADIPFTFPTDTTATWSAVPGASFYIAHIYQLREAAASERILSGAPAPFYRGQSRDFFLGFTTTPQTLGRELPFQGTVLTRRIMVPGTYQVRVSAIDPQGQLIAYTYGDSAIQTSETEYRKFPLGAAELPRPMVGGGGGGGPGAERAVAGRNDPDRTPGRTRRD